MIGRIIGLISFIMCAVLAALYKKCAIAFLICGLVFLSFLWQVW